MSAYLKRIILFAHDLITEAPAIWSWARHNDCERNGGHRWTGESYHPTMRAFGQTCSRCKCWQPSAIQPTIGTTNGTGSAYTFHITGSN